MGKAERRRRRSRILICPQTRCGACAENERVGVCTTIFSPCHFGVKMPGIEEKNESEDEDMEQDTPESDKSDDDDSLSGSGSDEDASSGWKCQQCKLVPLLSPVIGFKALF